MPLYFYVHSIYKTLYIENAIFHTRSSKPFSQGALPSGETVRSSFDKFDRQCIYYTCCICIESLFRLRVFHGCHVRHTQNPPASTTGVIHTNAWYASDSHSSYRLAIRSSNFWSISNISKGIFIKVAAFEPLGKN